MGVKEIEDIKEQLQHLNGQTEKILLVLSGDEELGVDGLVKDIKQNTHFRKKTEKKIIGFKAIFATGTLANLGVSFSDKLKEFFSHIF